jgi:metal-responsive CopG/Arc/MetJ family transcriptional regulator
MRNVVSVSLPKKLATELDVLSKETGRSKSDIAKDALAEFLWENRFRRMKKRILSQAKIDARTIQEHNNSKSPQF